MSSGQANASSAAILVAVIGLLIVGYILALPPDARDELLYGSGGGPGGSGGGGGFGGSGSGPVLIMTETPGTLQLQGSPEVEHSIPSTTVFTTSETVAIKELSSLYVKNSLFSNDRASFSFSTEQLQADNFLLTFNVDAARGNLIILLNGQRIFDQEITEKSPQPIRIPREELIEGENNVTLIASGVGFRFWSRNEYQLRNIVVSADAMNLEGTTSTQQFSIPEREFERLEQGELEFIPGCEPESTGRLVVSLNGALLYSGYADCGVLNRLDASKEVLRPGQNMLRFVSEGGSYLLDNIKFTSFLQQQDYPTYYFNLPLEFYEPLDRGDSQLVMTMRFADYRPVKRGEVTINGFVQQFEAQEYVYQASIDPNIIVPGPNTIQVIPHVDELNIAELKIEMV